MAKQITPTRRNDALIEAGKEILMVALLAVLPLLISQLESGNGIDYRIILITGIIAVLRGIDKFLYELGKSTDNESMEKGLTRF